MRERLKQALDSAPDRTHQSSKCLECNDLGYLILERGLLRCECQRQRILQQKLNEIPERFRGSTFLNYVPMDQKQQDALVTMSADFTRSFYLHGDYARGKTHLATAQYKKLIEIERPCLFLSMGELLSEFRKAELDVDYFCLVRHRVRYANRFHLFVDDIDKFKATDFKTEALFDLFDTVYKRQLGLTVTSNCTLAELRMIHPSIVRRIDDTCRAIEV